MQRSLWRPIAVVAILVITAAVFADYFVTHPAVGRQLSATSPAVLISLLALYGLFMVSLGLIFKATLLLCRTKLPLGETMLVTMYSSIINFFGPLQSGPAFRGIYLKKKHDISLKIYTAATLAYYGIFALLSGLCLLSGVMGWWLLVIVAFSGLAFWCLRFVRLPVVRRFWQLDLRGLYAMGLATLVQVVIMTTIFYIELHGIDSSINLGQVIVYTGAANFALFVSITPGAIGFRESFLVLSQQLHHIDNATIVAANLLDRSVYIVMLLVLVAIIFGTHARSRLLASLSSK